MLIQNSHPTLLKRILAGIKNALFLAGRAETIFANVLKDHVSGPCVAVVCVPSATDAVITDTISVLSVCLCSDPPRAGLRTRALFPLDAC